MNRTFLIGTAMLAAVAVSCGKSENGNKGVVAQQNGSATPPEDKGETLRYVAEDGSSALVTFKDHEDDKSISILSNNKTISAPQKSEGVYTNFDIEIVAKNDSVIITQGDNVINLKKARGQ